MSFSDYLSITAARSQAGFFFFRLIFLPLDSDTPRFDYSIDILRAIPDALTDLDIGKTPTPGPVVPQGLDRKVENLGRLFLVKQIRDGHDSTSQAWVFGELPTFERYLRVK